MFFNLDPTYLTAIGYYALVKSIVIPSLLASFGVLTVRNVQKLSRHTVASNLPTNAMENVRAVPAIHHGDHQLIRVLLAGISTSRIQRVFSNYSK
jgi:hypothetical protein